jgi:hypothetical protein
MQVIVQLQIRIEYICRAFHLISLRLICTLLGINNNSQFHTLSNYYLNVNQVLSTVLIATPFLCVDTGQNYRKKITNSYLCNK